MWQNGYAYGDAAWQVRNVQRSRRTRACGAIESAQDRRGWNCIYRIFEVAPSGFHVPDAAQAVDEFRIALSSTTHDVHHS